MRCYVKEEAGRILSTFARTNPMQDLTAPATQTASGRCSKKDNRTECYVLQTTHDCTVLGACIIRFVKSSSGDFMLVTFFAVHDMWRGQGVGRQMAADIAMMAQTTNKSKSVLVLSMNETKDFWEKMGYQQSHSARAVQAKELTQVCKNVDVLEHYKLVAPWHMDKPEQKRFSYQFEYILLQTKPALRCGMKIGSGRDGCVYESSIEWKDMSERFKTFDFAAKIFVSDPIKTQHELKVLHTLSQAKDASQRIAQLLWCGRVMDGLTVAIMPCGSGSLASDVKGNGWKSDVQSVARALSQILGCLHFVHDNGYVHRDVALRNFVYFDDAIKVVDFGSAKSISEEPDSLFRDYRALIHMAAEMLQLCDDCGEADKPKTKKEKERFLLSKFAKVKPHDVSEKEELMHDMARLCTKRKLGTQEDWLKVVQLDQVPS